VYGGGISTNVIKSLANLPSFDRRALRGLFDERDSVLGMPAALALLVVLASQLGFWALLRAGFFLSALGANVLFWCFAFPGWVVAGQRWWRTSATPDVMLAFLTLALAAFSFRLASDDLSEATQNAWFWLAMFQIPVALIAATLATQRTRALRRGMGTGPKPMTALIIAAAILSVALAVFAVLILGNVGGPH
jgi:hypothetical protein